MKCKMCGTELKENAQYCHICGCKIQYVYETYSPVNEPATCAHCGSMLKPGANFCGKCRAKVQNKQNNMQQIVKESVERIREHIPDEINIKLKPSGPITKEKAFQWFHTFFSSGYAIYLLIAWKTSGSGLKNFGDLLISGLVYKLTTPYTLLMLLAAIFSIVGLRMKKPWGYLSATIIQIVASLIIVLITVSNALWLIITAAMIISGFTSYNYVKKMNSNT